MGHLERDTEGGHSGRGFRPKHLPSEVQPSPPPAPGMWALLGVGPAASPRARDQGSPRGQVPGRHSTNPAIWAGTGVWSLWSRGQSSLDVPTPKLWLRLAPGGIQVPGLRARS